jgi:glycosyltransferase involved in cell wall biosynthesis
MRRAALYICYYHITEPLVHAQVVAYLHELAKRDIEIHLLTFERDHLSQERRGAITEELKGLGIHWHSVKYHQRPSLLATLFDIVVGALVAGRLCRKHRIALVHARSHVAAAMALVLKRTIGCKVLFDIRGLLADEYVDADHWKPGELKYRLTKTMERVFYRKSDAFIVLTNRLKAELISSEPFLTNREDDITVIPCCVDLDKFSSVPEERDSLRNQFGWSARRVLIYIGKLSKRYLPDEMATFFSALRQLDSRWFFQVLTQSDAGIMEASLRGRNLPDESYDIRFASGDELPSMLAASDAAIGFYKLGLSKTSVSPTKIGEYLAAGIPVASSSEIGDCDQIIGQGRLGVVVRELSVDEYRRAALELLQFLDDGNTSRRCRAYAERELSLSAIGGPRYAAVYERLLGQSERRAILGDGVPGKRSIGLTSSTEG